MKITLERQENKLHFEGKNESGSSVQFDSPAYGYEPAAANPMQVVLMSAAACSSIDVVFILEKMKQQLDDIKVDVEAHRDENEKIKPFRKVHLHFKLYGNIEEDKAEKAVSLSVDKYCSVLEMIKSTAEITHSLEIIKK
jgi:putative redox protein